MVVPTKAFTPSREDPAVLAARTVGRDDLLAALRRALDEAATSQSRPHQLIVGPRGAGKSHVLEVALHQARNRPGARDRLLFARLHEDAVGITSAHDVLLQLLLALSPAPHVREQGTKARADRDLSTLKRLIDQQARDRCLVAVIENLQIVMEGIGEEGQSDLRSWVESSGNVLVLATAPLLFHAVQRRDAPWFGSFAVNHLPGLSVDEGARLLSSAATEVGDTELSAFVATPRGRSRLEAVHHLAGGSPRIWTVFASCVSVASLDELVPAVEQLLEELVPYYQQRLWELPPVEQKLLDTLAREKPTATVTRLSELSGVPRPTTGTVLQRLGRAGWVSSRKMPGQDQRQTWYELREPMLRHHLQYRDTQGSELKMVVEMLQTWFDTQQRREFLRDAPLDSSRVRYLARTLATEPQPGTFDELGSFTLDDLETAGRLWLHAEDPEIATREAGQVLLAIAALVRGEKPPSEVDLAVEMIQAMVASLERSEDQPVVQRVAAALGVALDHVDRPWSGGLPIASIRASAETSPEAGHRQAEHVLSVADGDGTASEEEVLRIRAELNWCLAQAGHHDQALTEYDTIITDYTQILGPNHPQTVGVGEDRRFVFQELHPVNAESDTTVDPVTDKDGRFDRLIELAGRRLAAEGLEQPTGDVRPTGEIIELVERVALEGDADAYAALPREIRTLIDRSSDDGA